MSYDLGCTCENLRVVWTDVNGSLQPLRARLLRKQCQDCGRLWPPDLPHRMATTTTPSVKQDILVAWNAGRDAYWDERAIARREEQERRDADWRAAYSDHINSDAWREMRTKILQRDRYTCQGCLSAPAHEVHHLTYSHTGREFGWQLIAVCDACHDRFHNGDAA